MSVLKSLLARIKRFRQDTAGNGTIEFCLFMPILFWAYGASYVFFDAYRQSAMNLKAAYTVGDLISRETQAITPAYIDSLYNITKLLTRTDTPMSMRITVIRWDEEDDIYYLDWSQVRGDVSAMTQAQVADIKPKLPVMPDEERVILVETWNTWNGVMRTGLGTQVLDNFVFTRPRFAPQVIFEGGDA
ncbi:MAG: pilus assembly protein [Aestuariivita sp.]|uniref:TadE/TadG family type IV pilus assembly protein n=1 Tax=Aestuariivita sp. TaxID=1872407 RepID=UPI003BAE3CF1